MENDDLPVGRVLSRREVLGLLGLSGASFLAACAPEVPTSIEPDGLNIAQSTQVTAAENTIQVPSCVVQPELAEGPFYVDADFNRSDIRSDPATGLVKEGVPLHLQILVSQVSAAGCLPLENARVEVWHCDAMGVYSGVSDRGVDARDQKFLRGYQTSDSAGKVAFTTIYPGWYSGRCIHIHFKVHYDGIDASRVFVSQLFFDDTLSDEVLSQAPYTERGARNTLNSQDRIFDPRLILEAGRGEDAYAASFNLGIQFD